MEGRTALINEKQQEGKGTLLKTGHREVKIGKTMIF